MRTGPALLASIAMALPAAVAAESPPLSPETLQDFRCLAVAAILMTTEDVEGAQAAGLMGSMYYFGRIDGRAPDADLEQGIVDASLTISNAAKFAAEAELCGALLAARGKILEQAGLRVQARAAKIPNT